MPLLLKPGTQVIPAMLLYSGDIELEMIVVDGKYMDEEHETVGPVGDFGPLCVVTRLRI